MIKMNTETFEKYLIDVHAAQYHGTDDDMPDNFVAWVVNLEVSDVMEYAEDCIAAINEANKKQ
jgi:hypothetical protein